jgi:hypothetical protein
MAQGLCTYTHAFQGQVVPLSLDFNVQTHVEVERTKYWVEHPSTVKILHFTEMKGWQCEERHAPPAISIDDMPNPCKKEVSICLCREAHLYWNALTQAYTLANRSVAEAGLLQ